MKLTVLFLAFTCSLLSAAEFNKPQAGHETFLTPLAIASSAAAYWFFEQAHTTQDPHSAAQNSCLGTFCAFVSCVYVGGKIHRRCASKTPKL